MCYYSACNSPVDKDGLRHLLLTRAILGKSEVVQIGSNQCHPSSEEFDSGMDNLQSPRKIIVWSTHMNTHTLPEYVVSFRAPPSLAGKQLRNFVLIILLSLMRSVFLLFSKFMFMRGV